MSLTAENRLREYIRTFVRELLSTNEITQTGDIAGYNTPFAFSSKKKKDKDKTDKEDDKATEEIAPLLAQFKVALGEAVKDVRASERLTESVVCLVTDEDLTLEMLREWSGERLATYKVPSLLWSEGNRGGVRESVLLEDVGCSNDLHNFMCELPSPPSCNEGS